MLFKGKIVFTRTELKVKKAEGLIEIINRKTRILLTQTGGTSTIEYQSDVKRYLNDLLESLIGKGTEEDLIQFQKVLVYELEYYTFNKIYFAEILIKCWDDILTVEKNNKITLFPNEYVRTFAKNMISVSKQ